MLTAIVPLLLLLQAASGQNAAGSLAVRAQTASAAGNYPEAIALFREAIAKDPGWKEGLWNLASLYYATNDFHTCLEPIQRLRTLAPKDGPVWTMLGLCEYGEKQFVEASEHLRTGQRLGLGGSEQLDLAAKHDLATLLTQAGAFEQALELYYALAKGGTPPTTALLQDAGTAALHMALMPAELPANDHEVVYLAGKAFWEIASGQASKANVLFETLARQYPQTPNVHYFYGSYLLTVDPDAGLAELRKEIALSPHNVAALVTAAVELLRQNDLTEALPLAQEAVRYGPDSFAAYTVLGRIHVEQGKLQEGVTELEQARKLSPESPQPRIALAAAYGKLGRREDAARERQEFLRLNAAAKKSGEQ